MEASSFEELLRRKRFAPFRPKTVERGDDGHSLVMVIRREAFVAEVSREHRRRNSRWHIAGLDLADAA